MSEYDVHSSLKTLSAFDFDATLTIDDSGNSIDTKFFEGLEYAVAVGAVTGAGPLTATLEQSDDNSIWTAVPSELVLGSISFVVSTDDNTVQHIGTVGKSQFQRIVINGSTVTNAEVSAVALLQIPHSSPTDDA